MYTEVIKFSPLLPKLCFYITLDQFKAQQRKKKGAKSAISFLIFVREHTDDDVIS